MKEKKNIIIIILSFLLFIALAIIIVLVTRKEDILKEVSGRVIISDKNYVIVSSDDKDYLISNIKGTYKTGDEIKLTFKESNLDKKEEPYKIIIEDEELLKSYINVPNTDNNKEETPIKEPEKETNNTSNNTNTTTNTNTTSNVSNNTNNNASNSNTSSNNTNSNTNNTPKPVAESVDDTVINYVNTLKAEADKPTITSSIKSGFVTVVDFIFYNGSIKGHTFKELSDSAKLKVLSLALYLDEKVDKYFPGYKESISNTASKVYTNVKEQIVTSYLTITTTICKENTEGCNKAKEGFQNIKNNFSLTWSLIKDIAGDGITNLKNWYEIWREK